MPDQSHPPYADGALTIPRTLTRWLDVNAQNGSLRRIQTYITLPAFTRPNVWNGYSDIVASFNCEAPNNFSLTGWSTNVPATPNYALCISYRIGNTLTRYLLWDAVGSNLTQSITPYAGQPILKNFRFEVWNTSQGISSQDTAVSFYTSVAGQVDYRYGTDIMLKKCDTENDNFNCTSGETSLTNAPATGLLVNFRGDTGVTGVLWNPIVNTFPEATPIWGTLNINTIVVNGHTCVNLTLFTQAVPATMVSTPIANLLVIIIYGAASAGGNTKFLSLSKYAVGSQLNFKAYPSGNQVSAGDCILSSAADIDTLQLTETILPNFLTGSIPNYTLQATGVITTAGNLPIDVIEVFMSRVYVAEIMIYDRSKISASITFDITRYLANHYNGSAAVYNLPLIFPTTSVSTTN